MARTAEREQQMATLREQITAVPAPVLRRKVDKYRRALASGDMTVEGSYKGTLPAPEDLEDLIEVAEGELERRGK